MLSCDLILDFDAMLIHRFGNTTAKKQFKTELLFMDIISGKKKHWK